MKTILDLFLQYHLFLPILVILLEGMESIELLFKRYIFKNIIKFNAEQVKVLRRGVYSFFGIILFVFLIISTSSRVNDIVEDFKMNDKNNPILVEEFYSKYNNKFTGEEINKAIETLKDRKIIDVIEDLVCSTKESEIGWRSFRIKVIQKIKQ